MIKKTTQNSIKSIWCGCILAFTFLFSLTISSQEVGQEYLLNPDINTTATSPDTGVDGNGNFSTGVLGGWGSGTGGAYAKCEPEVSSNGDCHSVDRLFKLFKTGNSSGQNITQTVTLPAGNYDWSFWTKWGALVSWDDDDDSTPKFTILTNDDNDTSWETVQTVVTTQPTAIDTWVEQTGTYTNDVERQVRIKFSKYGGTSTAPSNLNQLMFIDDVSLKYASAYNASTDDTSLSDLTIDGVTINGFTSTGSTYDVLLAEGTTVVPTVVATTTNSNATSVITDATSIPGTTSILVTAEDGTTTNTVSINFSALQVGQEFLVNPGVNTATGATSTTPDTGVDGSGNFAPNGILGGWGTGNGGAYAQCTAANGDCHSLDRMFKLFKKGDSGGQFVTQTVTLPAGTYNWSFWTKWLVLVSWGNTGDYEPTFKIQTYNSTNSAWDDLQTVVTTQPTTADTWVQQTGTFVNVVERQVRIRFHKYGGLTDALTNLAELMFIDDVSLQYESSSLGISEEELTSFSIYPNPTSQSIYVKGIENIKSIKIYSILGSLQKEVSQSSQINVSELASGVYIVKVDNGNIYTRRVIIE